MDTVMCGCGCGPFTPAKQRKKFKTDECSERVHGGRGRKELAERVSGHPARHPRTAAMWAMRAELDAKGGAGRCIFCEGPLGKVQKLACTKPKCGADYMALYDHAKRAERRAEPDWVKNELSDADPVSAEVGVAALASARLRLSCEIGALRAKVEALARDYGLTPPARAA